MKKKAKKKKKEKKKKTNDGWQPSVTCKRSWESLVVTKRDFVVVFPLAAAAVVGCQVDGQRWIQSHLSVRASFQLARWAVNVSQPSGHSRRG